MPHDKADILADYRNWRLQQEDRIGTHSDDCHLWPRHERCMIHRLAAEVERLRNYPAKPDSSTITAEDREALERVSVAYGLLPTAGAREVSATLRSLLERLSP